jgi:hypothetical protein
MAKVGKAKLRSIFGLVQPISTCWLVGFGCMAIRNHAGEKEDIYRSFWLVCSSLTLSNYCVLNFFVLWQ